MPARVTFGRNGRPGSHLGGLPSAAGVAAYLLVGLVAMAQDQPKLLPTRDVEITYDVTRPPQRKTREHVRWLASEHLERVESSGRSITIFDRGAHAVTLLMPANRTYQQIGRRPAPAIGARAGGDSQARQRCRRRRIGLRRLVVDGGRGNAHVCTTADGVMLRLIVDGQTFAEARSVKYAPQKAELFQVPPNYAPALAPAGGAEP